MKNLSENLLSNNELQRENERLQSYLQEIRAIAETHDYWSSNLQKATVIINNILDLTTKAEKE